MSTREDPQLSRLAPLDETARAPRVKTSVIKQWAGLCRPNGSRTICRNAKDYVRRDPVFPPFDTSGVGFDRRRTMANPRAMILAIPREPLSRANPIDFMAFPQCEDHGARATDRRRGFAKVVELGQTWPVSASGRCGLLLIGR